MKFIKDFSRGTRAADVNRLRKPQTQIAEPELLYRGHAEKPEPKRLPNGALGPWLFAYQENP